MIAGKKISRRGMLKALAVASGGLALNLARRSAALDRAIGQAPALTPQTYLPFVTGKGFSPSQGKVVHIHAAEATTWSGQNRYWEHIDQGAVDRMVERGVIELTGTATAADAWRRLIPGYQPGKAIAIKVNFNNSWSCSNTNRAIDALIHPVNAVARGLEHIGVARQDIWVYDAVRALPDRFVSAGLTGIRFFDRYCSLNAGFGSQAEAYVQFYPPVGMSMPAQKISNVIMDAAYLINMPIMKGGHPLAGVTLGFKNHFGTIHNCSALHNYVDAVHKPSGYNRDYNPMVDFLRSPQIGGKTILTIGDALLAAKDFNDPPETWTTFGNKVPNSLFFATDPVAIDCVMHDFIAAELGGNLTAAANRYLALAGSAGLGVYEGVNPWTEMYSQIRYSRVEL